jgi:hypothetical protein
MAMAPHQPNSSIKQHVVTITRDEEDREIHRTQYSEDVTRLPDGSIISEKTAENFALASGELYNPSLSSGSNPVMLVGVCALCGTTSSIFPRRRRRTTRLCNVEQLKNCSDCGYAICPSHRRKGEDRKWRCLSCHRKHWWASLLSPLFFEEVDE